MTGYHTQRYEAECGGDECDRTIRTIAPERQRSRGVMIQCRECGHINFTRTVVEPDYNDEFEGVLL